MPALLDIWCTFSSAGYCSGTDVCAGLLSCVFPCLPFARNMQRALSLSFVGQLILYFLLVYVARSTAVGLVVRLRVAPSLLLGPPTAPHFFR